MYTHKHTQTHTHNKTRTHSNPRPQCCTHRYVECGFAHLPSHARASGATARSFFIAADSSNAQRVAGSLAPPPSHPPRALSLKFSRVCFLVCPFLCILHARPFSHTHARTHTAHANTRLRPGVGGYNCARRRGRGRSIWRAALGVACHAMHIRV